MEQNPIGKNSDTVFLKCFAGFFATWEASKLLRFGKFFMEGISTPIPSIVREGHCCVHTTSSLLLACPRPGKVTVKLFVNILEHTRNRGLKSDVCVPSHIAAFLGLARKTEQTGRASPRACQGHGRDIPRDGPEPKHP